MKSEEEHELKRCMWMCSINCTSREFQCADLFRVSHAFIGPVPSLIQFLDMRNFYLLCKDLHIRCLHLGISYKMLTFLSIVYLPEKIPNYIEKLKVWIQ